MRNFLAIALLLVPGLAKADTILRYTTTSMSASNGRAGTPLTVVYDISDAAVTRGSFSLSAVGIGQPAASTFSGNVADYSFIDVTVAGETERVRPGYIYGTISTSLSFDTSGNLLSSNLTYLGTGNEARISGSGSKFFGTVGSDEYNCNSTPGSNNGCLVAGVYTVTRVPGAVMVPEPESIALLAMAGLVTVAVRRKKLF